MTSKSCLSTGPNVTLEELFEGREEGGGRCDSVASGPPGKATIDILVKEGIETVASCFTGRGAAAALAATVAETGEGALGAGTVVGSTATVVCAPPDTARRADGGGAVALIGGCAGAAVRVRCRTVCDREGMNGGAGPASRAHNGGAECLSKLGVGVVRR